jgi:pyridoxal phosphate enzyme (YggS family)
MSDVPDLSPAAVAERWQRLRARLEACGGLGVDVVAVTKGHDHRAVEAARAIGLLDVGENYAQEMVAKTAEIDDPGALRWHAIGRLQRNKVRLLAPLVHLWQTVDRPELGREIARRAPGAAVLVQVDVSDEPQKGGTPFADAGGLVALLRDLGLEVRGLMAVGPTGPPEDAAEPFRRLVGLADDLQLPVRSIGMSADLEVAVAAGSTMVRIGTDLFGPRPDTAGERGVGIG